MHAVKKIKPCASHLPFSKKGSFQKRISLNKRCFSTSKTINSSHPILNHLSNGVKRLTNSEITHGKGSYLFTRDNKKILDLATGIGVNALGHGHPKFVKALTNQVETLVHSGQNFGIHPPMVAAVEKLSKISPKGLSSFFFCNSGSEAVENAFKIARQKTKKNKIISFNHAFHGRTFGAMAATTSSSSYSFGFSPLMPGVVPIPFPYCHRCPTGSLSNCCFSIEKEMDEVFKTKAHPEETAAVILEPVLGEGGYVVPPKQFVKDLAKVCKENNILLIADEVQTGLRTGSWWAIDNHFGVTPDILTFAKAIGNGIPVAGLAARKDLLDDIFPGSLGGTYGGNPVALRALESVIGIIEEDQLFDNVQIRSQQLVSHLKNLQNRFPDLISDVRGLGLMIAMEFNDKNVAKGTAANISKKCAENGMFLLSTGLYETLRFIPPITISSEEVDEALQILEKSMKDLNII